MGDGGFCHDCRRARCECEDYLREIAAEFRYGILEGKSGDLMCFAISAPLAGLLCFMGYDADVVEGEIELPGDMVAGHWWVQIGDKIIDATADQFNAALNKTMPAVYVGPRPEWYRPAKRLQAELAKLGGSDGN